MGICFKHIISLHQIYEVVLWVELCYPLTHTHTKYVEVQTPGTYE